MADQTSNDNSNVGGGMSSATTPPVQPVPASDPLATSMPATTGSRPVTSGGMDDDLGATPEGSEARSRFNAALEEAKAGASALKDEAWTRANSYRDQARGRSRDLSVDARTKAGELAGEGKMKASGALHGLSQLVDENAARIDENFGPQYGDYARNAGRQLREAADALERKSVEELGDDARAFVREQPGTAVGIAAVMGYVVARLFRK